MNNLGRNFYYSENLKANYMKEQIACICIDKIEFFFQSEQNAKKTQTQTKTSDLIIKETDNVVLNQTLV